MAADNTTMAKPTWSHTMMKIRNNVFQGITCNQGIGST